MEPNKFEKHIKRQLQEREIQPSLKAWKTLSERLDGAAPPAKERNYFWYSVAASFIGILIVSVLYFGLEGPDNTPNVQIVDTTDDVIEAKINKDTTAKKDIEGAVVETDKIEPSSTYDPNVAVEHKIPESNSQITSLGKIAGTDDEVLQNAIPPDDFKEEIINTKILELVAAVDSLEQNNTALTEAEVDELLRSAQEEILQDKLFSQNGTVDAMALLSEVEDELDQSFRDQIFESLKTGFLKVRTAVADRNN